MLWPVGRLPLQAVPLKLEHPLSVMGSETDLCNHDAQLPPAVGNQWLCAGSVVHDVLFDTQRMQAFHCRGCRWKHTSEKRARVHRPSTEALSPETVSNSVTAQPFLCHTGDM